MYIDQGEDEVKGTAKLTIQQESWDEYAQFVNHTMDVNVQV